MNIHVRVAATLHVFLGLISACSLMIMTMALGGDAAFGILSDASRITVGSGAVLMTAMALLQLGQAFAGFKLLKGSRKARTVVIAFSILALFNPPWGMQLGAYTLWALLRKQPMAPDASKTAVPADLG